MSIFMLMVKKTSEENIINLINNVTLALFLYNMQG